MTEDKLFRNSKILKMSANHRYNALVGDFFSADLMLIADGYFHGANQLICDLKDEPSNILVYPIIFLYRHYLELALKSILYKYKMLGFEINDRIIRDHNILKLYEEVNTITQEKYPDRPLPEEIYSFIKEFHDFDATSQKFRYSTNIQGELWIKNHDTIGLDTLKQYMVKYEPYFYGLHYELSEETKRK